MGCPGGSALTIRKTATTPSAEPSKTSANWTPSVWSFITRSRRNRSALLVSGLRPEKRSLVERQNPVCFVPSLEKARKGKVFDVKERLNMNADLKKGWAWPGMLAGVKRRLCLVGVVLAFVSFVVAGCKINGAVEFRANGDMKFDFTFEDSRDTMVKIKQTCETVRAIFLAKVRFVDSPKVRM